MSVLDDLMVATQHLIGWEEGAEELARLRRMADLLAKRWVDKVGQSHQRGPGAPLFTYVYMCNVCSNEAETPDVIHTATCDVAIHLNLPREGA